VRASLLEWLASLLVALGVVLIAFADPSASGIDSLPAFIGGVVLLTLGVRLAIECGQVDR
jgi:hypothetical protein